MDRSPGIYRKAEKKNQKTLARRPSDEGAVRPVIASNGVPYLEMMSVGSHSTSGREKKGKKEMARKGRIYDDMQDVIY